jgi:integrase
MQDSDLHSCPERNRYEQVGEFVRIFRRGDLWYANFQHQGKQLRRSLKTKSKKEARSRAIRLENDLCGGGVQTSSRVPTIVEVIEEYKAFLQMESRAKETIARYSSVFDDLSLFAAGRNAIRISQVNLPFLDAYRQNRLGKKRQPTTVHKETVIIKQLLNFAVSRGRLAKNPLAGLKLKSPPKRPQPCWTWEEVKNILAAAEEPHRGVLTLLAETGMRIGELQHLTWDDIDFEQECIRVRQKVFFDPETEQTQTWKPKTGTQRAIPMNDITRTLLLDVRDKNETKPACKRRNSSKIISTNRDRENLDSKSHSPRECPWVFTDHRSATSPSRDRRISEGWL